MTFIFLSDEFYNCYASCPEIEKKSTRPYIQICIKINGKLFAVPLRSNIHHKFVLWTDKENKCGLDFTKSVVIEKDSYIDKDSMPHIRQNEFDALRGKEFVIKQKMLSYIQTYKKAKLRMDVPRNRRICEYSTLQYFEKYL